MTRFGKFLFLTLVLVLVAGGFFIFDKESEAPVSVLPDTPDSADKKLEILGRKEDLVSFSVAPGSRVSGAVPYEGLVRGGYFFEGNILVNVIAGDGLSVLRSGYAMAVGEWMTTEAVPFSGTLDFTGLPSGPAYIQIHNDNASGEPGNDKFILIPIVIAGYE